MAEYQAVPVEAARQVSRQFGKDVIVILSWDRQSNLVHTTTYGRDAHDKVSAANLGDIVTKAAGVDLTRATPFEDFRTRTVAEWAQEKDQLVGRIQELERLLLEK